MVMSERIYKHLSNCCLNTYRLYQMFVHFLLFIFSFVMYHFHVVHTATKLQMRPPGVYFFLLILLFVSISEPGNPFQSQF